MFDIAQDMAFRKAEDTRTCRLITYNMRAIREIGSLEATFGRKNDDPGSKETALVDKSPARELDFSRPITPPPPPELTRERRSTRRGAARRGAGGGSVLSLPDHQADLVPNYKSH
ncbi:hypothetical protein ALC62_00898 [Cyphomyrmex costatus]|uniref:Uncharacterized protein n=1 Tax=Cyphomyrmex costatus TaxID=456900 RepID=A0A195D590_9HYME|nr:hypothetical protein ALC62_00898 [Cyphomyrmex costatus]